MERHECEAFATTKPTCGGTKRNARYTKEMDVNFWGADNGSEVNSEDNTFLSDKNGTIWNIGTVLYGEKGLTPLEIPGREVRNQELGNPRTFADIRTNILCKGDTFGWDDDSDSTPMKAQHGQRKLGQRETVDGGLWQRRHSVLPEARGR